MAAAGLARFGDDVGAKQDDKPAFSESTRQALEELAREREHRKWLAEILQRWAKWIAAISVGTTIVWDAAHKLIAHFTIK